MKQLAMYARKSKAKPYSHGFTLLEILVSIVVLSFGLLGMVGIQAMALKSNNDAKQQSAAVQLAGELSEMMRGNKAVAISLPPANNPYIITNYQEVNGVPSAPTEDCSTLAGGCTTPLNIASWEIFDWLTRVNATFPDARVQVCFDTAPYFTSGVNIGLPQWGCPVGAAAGNSKISIKIGWTRESTNKTRVQTGNAAADAVTNSANAFVTAVTGRPSVIYIVTPGTGI